MLAGIQSIMATITVSTYLNAAPKVVRDHVQRTQLLEYVAKPILRFKPVEPPIFPEVWAEGNYRARMLFAGFIPLGFQNIGLEKPPMRGDTWLVRDNGSGTLVKTWDHLIEVSPEGDGTRYVDHVTIRAGLLTPFIVLFAHVFYRHRQRRWRRLVASGFDYGD